MTKEICDFDRDVIRTLNGEKIPNVTNGAAFWETAEFLASQGYLKFAVFKNSSIQYVPTDKGLAAIKDNK